MTEFEAISNHIINGNEDKVAELTQKAIDEGLEPNDIIQKGLINGMNQVSQKFKDEDMFVPEVMISAQAMKTGIELVNPLLTKEETSLKGRVLLGTVAGDLHNIGKNLVRIMMESAGFEVIDLGTDVEPKEFAEAVKEYKPDILGMSALLTTTIQQMQKTMGALKKEELRDSVKIMVGGGPVTPDFAEEINADFWAQDAVAAKSAALELVESSPPPKL
ncbi:cobalamin B12-binding domain-containing protein [Acetohalobium arabaticum]|uniref:Cobalamin B12-binding domain protein n=1 Tax=Acetohalobium arabaticum (strain ATCC 49924 / DSM 5501 / Z-7288) TaxID=574087 RepID=D9QUS6_ACEAZ|nr:corrinoid protein [Acetohalobium arabaticum]ADL11985.1 cobalamin B12-binding domain protein [Acetohalobium arabaticum DSM 5501]